MTKTVADPAQAALSTEAPAEQPESQSAVDAVRDKAAEVVDRAGDALEKAGDAVNSAADRAVTATREAAGNAVTRIRNNATMAAERGRTILANEVVEKIAGIAAREVPGVYDLGGDVARIFSAVKERLHLGEENQGQGVSVALDGRTAEITVTIVIEFGFQVFSVTDKVRQKVITSVENMLGLEVANVDVIVDDVHIDDAGPVGNDAERAPTYSGETQAIVVGAALASDAG